MYKSRFKKSPTRIAQRQKARRFAGFFLKWVLVFLFFACAIAVARADFMQVKNFEVSGAETLDADKVKSAAAAFASGERLVFIPQSNMLFLDKEKLASVLLSEFGRIEDVKVDKSLFEKSVRLTVSERKAEYLWCAPQNRCYFMTKEGYVFEKADADPEERIIFRGRVEGEPESKNFASQKEMQNFTELIINLKKGAVNVGSINVESSDKAVAKTNIGEIIFNPEEADLRTVAENVILLINEIGSKNPAARFIYLDARFGNKIFYKLR